MLHPESSQSELQARRGRELLNKTRQRHLHRQAASGSLWLMGGVCVAMGAAILAYLVTGLLLAGFGWALLCIGCWCIVTARVAGR